MFFYGPNEIFVHTLGGIKIFCAYFHIIMFFTPGEITYRNFFLEHVGNCSSHVLCELDEILVNSHTSVKNIYVIDVILLIFFHNVAYQRDTPV